MSTSTLLLLAALWGVVLLPRALRDVRSSPISTVTGFTDTMARLAVCDQRMLVVPAGSGRRVVALPRRSARVRAIRRRRALLVRLIVTAAVAVPGAALSDNAVADAAAGIALVALIAYCVAMRAIVVRRARGAVALASPDRRDEGAVALVSPGRRDEGAVALASPDRRDEGDLDGTRPSLSPTLVASTTQTAPVPIEVATPVVTTSSAPVPAAVPVPVPVGRGDSATDRSSTAITTGWLDDALDWTDAAAHECSLLAADGL